MKMICSNCGSEMISESLGYKCTNCKGLLDVKGVFHKHIEQPFMPPKTNFDRITESVEAFADWIFKSYTNVPENVPCTVENCETTDRMDCKKCFIKWLRKECEQ